MDWDSLMDCQGARSPEPEGRPGGPGDLQTAKEVLLALLSLPGPPSLPSGSGLPGNSSSYSNPSTYPYVEACLSRKELASVRLPETENSAACSLN